MGNNNPFSLMALAALDRKTEKRKAQAVLHHKRGKSLEQIALLLGVSTRSVRRYLPNVDWTVNTTKGC